MTNVAQQVFSLQMEKAEKNECNHLFQTYFVVRNRRCRVIIDRDSNRNIASLELVEKLGLTTQPHPCPYNIQSVNSCDNLFVDKIARIEFFIGTYKDSAEFDIIPMQACHLLFGQPWNDINNVLHNTVANKCSFKYNGRKITLIAMTATEILEADLERAERRKNEPFRKEWIISDVTLASTKYDILQNEDIPLSFVGTNTLQHVSKKRTR